MKKQIMLILLAMSLLSSCGQTGNIFKQIIGQDPDPPEGYNPMFVSKVERIKSDSFDSTQMVISRIDPYKENKVRLYVHLIEDGNTFLSGAADGNNKKIWCQLIDSVNGEEHIVKDFKIRESSKEDRKPQAIAMVMDHSGSMGDNRAKEVQSAVSNFLDISKKKDDEIALVKYDDSVGVECNLTRDLSELKSKFKTNGLGSFGKQTATLDGIVAGINQVSNAKSGLDRIVMVFTDGQDNKSHYKKDQVISLARKNNVMICAIDYGVAISEQFLENIAQATNGTYNHIYKAKEFNLVFRDIYLRLEKYYEIEFEPEEFGHHKVTLKLCPPKKESISSSMEFDNRPYEGLTTILNVNFDTNKDILKKDSYKEIEKMYSMMKKNPSMSIELRGHTDSKGSKEKNLKLSQDRADAVKEALVKKGIDDSRIKSVGYGDTVPIDSNDTEEGRSKNRRTEFLVLTK
jgi:outer membrane protein OmpA-like peptidoglycan-associated protein